MAKRELIGNRSSDSLFTVTALGAARPEQTPEEQQHVPCLGVGNLEYLDRFAVLRRNLDGLAGDLVHPPLDRAHASDAHGARLAPVCEASIAHLGEVEHAAADIPRQAYLVFTSAELLAACDVDIARIVVRLS